MDPFTITCARRGATLEFFDREPDDVSRPIDYFSVRVRDINLTASARVYHYGPTLVCLFDEIAAEWRGWDESKMWESLEGELKLRCGNDRRGHITIQAQFRSGHYDHDWFVQSAVIVEAGQLDDIARRARKFFGAGA
ncbi:MAG TPA: DUF6228 family protein [Gemmataceae bacterium]|nr:DUF6228 family protein [Gemmataceae bacterium]